MHLEAFKIIVQKYTQFFLISLTRILMGKYVLTAYSLGRQKKHIRMLKRYIFVGSFKYSVVGARHK